MDNWAEHNKKVKEMMEKYPHINPAIWDIEASEEMAMMYEEMGGMI